MENGYQISVSKDGKFYFDIWASDSRYGTRKVEALALDLKKRFPNCEIEIVRVRCENSIVPIEHLPSYR